MLRDLIQAAVVDGDRTNAVREALLPDGSVSPDASWAAAELLNHIIDAPEEHYDLLELLITLAEREQLVADVLRLRSDDLLTLVQHDDDLVSTGSAELLAFCGPNPALATVLREQLTGEIGPWLLVAAARLDPASAPQWLPEYLNCQPPVIAASAVLAMRRLGLPATQEMADVVVTAWTADPHLRLPDGKDAKLFAFSEYLGSDLLIRIADGGVAARRAVAETLQWTVKPDIVLPGELAALVLDLLDDPDRKTQQSAWRTACTSDALAFVAADRLARAVAENHPARRGALDALARIGDPRWRDSAAEALRDGWSTAQVALALRDSDLPLDEQTRAAILSRVDQLARTIEFPSRPRDGLRELNRLLASLHADPASVDRLAALLPHTTQWTEFVVAQTLASASDGNPAAIAALEQRSSGDIKDLRLVWLAGGNAEPLRATIAAAAPADAMAAVTAIELDGPDDAAALARLREAFAHEEDLAARMILAELLWEVTNDPSEVEDTVREALTSSNQRAVKRATALADALGLTPSSETRL